jgi:hypothetical protein
MSKLFDLKFSSRVAVLIGMMLISNISIAAEGSYFYNEKVSDWTVAGYTGDPSVNPSCFVRKDWADGSAFELVKDLEDGELYIWFQNNGWNIIDEPGEYEMRLNIHYYDGDINGNNFGYLLINKNTIVIPQIEVESFVTAFHDGTNMVMVMPGDIENAEVSLDKSKYSLELLAECIDKSKGVDLNSTKDEIKSKIAA